MLLIELAKIIRTASDNEFSQYHGSFPYFSSQHNLLGEKWEERLEKKNIRSRDDRRKDWQQTIREIRYWEDQDLDYMYERIMALSRQFLGKKIKYFTVETFSGQATIPDRMQILNRLIELSNELLTKIYPTITRLLNYRIDDVVMISSNISGTVNWNKTIQYALKNSGGELISFAYTMPTRSFQTPENVLLLLGVTLLHNDAKQILDFQNKEFISTEDKKIIWDVANSTKKILDEPFLSEINRKTKIIREIGNSIPDIKKILEHVEKNLRLQRTTQKEYYNLVNWIRNYIDFNVNRYQNLSNFTLENVKDVDTMFELWILFEFVTYLKKMYGANVTPITKSKKKENKLQGFKIEIDGNEFYFMYEHVFTDIPVGSIIKPDFTFEFGDKCLCDHDEESHFSDEKGIHQCEFGKESEDVCDCKQFRRRNVPIVLDAKNWRTENRMVAVQKMSWYLMNMNQYGVKIGILLFSNYKPGQDTTNPETDHWGPMKINEGVWEFLNFVVKSSPKIEYKEQLYQVFDYIYKEFPFVRK